MMTVRQASYLIDWVIVGLIVIWGLFFRSEIVEDGRSHRCWLDDPCANWFSNRAAPFTKAASAIGPALRLGKMAMIGHEPSGGTRTPRTY